jgi:hypothetical protein
MDFFDANLVQKLCAMKKQSMTLALGLHIVSGLNIFVLSEIESEEEIRFDAKYRGAEYVIVVRPDT